MLEVSGGQYGGALRSPPPEESAEAGGQHHEGERLGEEVVGAGVEGLGLVEFAIFGREHEDRRPVAVRPQG